MSTALLLFLAAFLTLILSGMPIAWAMAAATLIYMAVTGQWHLLPALPEKIYQGMDAFVLVAIPLFLLAGDIFSEGKIADRLIDFARALLGRVPGGIAQVAIGACVFFAGITGVALGEIAALGRVFVPAMVRAGYPAPFAAAVIASASIIGPTIPPSLPIIIYGAATNASIGGLFAAAVVPGLLLAVGQMALVAFQAKRMGVVAEEVDRSVRTLARTGRKALLPLGLPVLILSAILGGLLTPTEAAGASVAYAAVCAFVIYRSLAIRQVPEILSRVTAFSGQLIIIVACGSAFAWVLGFENVTTMLTQQMAQLQLTKVEVLLLTNLVYLVLGMFIDPTTAIILFAPIFAQVATAAGVDPLHFGVITIVNLNIGLITPPLGVALFAAERITRCGLRPVIIAAFPFIGINVAVLMLITLFPALSLWLPRLAGL